MTPEVNAKIRLRKGLEWAQSVGTDPMHPWNGSEWLRYVESSFPPAVYGRLVAHAVKALVREQIAAEEWRAKQEFVTP